MTGRTRNSKPDEAKDRDLAVWHREASPEPGEFSNPDTSEWIVYEFRREDLLKSPALDASHLVEAPSGTHGFLRSDSDGHFVFEDGTPVRFIGDRLTCSARRIIQPGMRNG